MLSIKKYNLTRFPQIVYNLTMAPLLDLAELIKIRSARAFRFVTQTLRSYRTSKEQSVHSGLLPGVEYVAVSKTSGDVVVLSLIASTSLQVQREDRSPYVVPATYVAVFDIVGEL